MRSDKSVTMFVIRLANNGGGYIYFAYDYNGRTRYGN